MNPLVPYIVLLILGVTILCLRKYAAEVFPLHGEFLLGKDRRENPEKLYAFRLRGFTLIGCAFVLIGGLSLIFTLKDMQPKRAEQALPANTSQH